MPEAARQERRRLAAILAADVVGYAGLIAADEAGTLGRLRALFRETVQPLVAAYGGRIFRLLGDALLTEFPSAVEALRCAIALQAAVAERTSVEPGKVPIALRIGLALGDVVVEGGDLYGDGVNTAARLEALAEPGGILVSAAVAEQAQGRVDCVLEDAGPLTLKNIPRPVYAFQIRGAIPAPAPSRRPVSSRLSLAVLPFAHPGGDAAEEWFAKGITEELSTALTRVHWFQIVARNSAAAYKARPLDLRQVGRELGARYVLDGSVRRAGGRLRVVVQLMEAETGRHVWADRFEDGTEDDFALQDQVTEIVVGTLGPVLLRAEIERVRTLPEAELGPSELSLRAVSFSPRLTREESDEALALLGRAMALDPDYAPAKANALVCHVHRAAQGWALPGEREDAVRLAHEAQAAHTEDALTLAAVADTLGSLAFDLEGALKAARRAVALNPNSAWVQSSAGYAHCRSGAPEAAIAHFQRALKLTSRAGSVVPICPGLGYACLMLGRPEEALAWGEKALQQAPAVASGHRVVIAALVELGRQDEAEAAARRYLQGVPNARANANVRRLYRDQVFAERLIRNLRTAGLPD
jgi:adenylate cyclase